MTDFRVVIEAHCDERREADLDDLARMMDDLAEQQAIVVADPEQPSWFEVTITVQASDLINACGLAMVLAQANSGRLAPWSPRSARITEVSEPI